MAKEKKTDVEVTAPVEEKEAVKSAEQVTEEFIARKMVAINEMASPAKAKRAATRVLANRRKVGK